MKELIYSSLIESKAVLDQFVSWETAASIDEVATAMARSSAVVTAGRCVMRRILRKN